MSKSFVIIGIDYTASKERLNDQQVDVEKFILKFRSKDWVLNLPEKSQKNQH